MCVGQARLRDRWCCIEPRQGAHGLVARAAAEESGPEGHDAEARPVHQRRSRHDEPLPARRGVRHRRQGRDRPRPRALRALRRRPAHAPLERDHRVDLPVGARQGTQGRVPRRDRAGDPAHHQRDQAAHPGARERRRRRRDHRGRRHGRRHRDPAVPRSDPAVPQGRRARERLLRARDPGAVHRAVGRAEDQADPALGHRAARPRHPARRDRLPQRPADLQAAEGEDLRAVRRARGRASSPRSTPTSSTRSRSCSTTRASTTTCARCCTSTSTRPTSPSGRRSSTGCAPRRTTCASGSSASTSTCPTRTSRWSRRSSTAATPAAPTCVIDWIAADDAEGLLAESRLHDLDGIVVPGGFGMRGIPGKIEAAGYARAQRDPVPRPVPRPALRGHRVRPRRVRPREREQLASSTRARRIR